MQTPGAIANTTVCHALATPSAPEDRRGLRFQEAADELGGNSDHGHQPELILQK
jgi:hypothetical protein